MATKTGKLFTISEFAALHQINKKTLMWYEQVGLFKPAYVKENGYRYYSYQQCTTLDTILMLRELNISIPEIKEFLKEGTLASYYQMILKKEEEIDRTIRYLKEIKKALVYQKNELDDEQVKEFGSYEIIDKPKQHLILLHTDRKDSLEKQTELIFQEAKHHTKYRMYGILYGSVIPVKSLYENDFTDYTGVFLQMPNTKGMKNRYMQKKGKYLRTFYQGDWDNLSKQYQKMMEYAKEHQIPLEGYAFETGINDGMCIKRDDYITKIEIPIKEA